MKICLIIFFIPKGKRRKTYQTVSVKISKVKLYILPVIHMTKNIT